MMWSSDDENDDPGVAVWDIFRAEDSDKVHSELLSKSLSSNPNVSRSRFGSSYIASRPRISIDEWMRSSPSPTSMLQSLQPIIRTNAVLFCSQTVPFIRKRIISPQSFFVDYMTIMESSQFESYKSQVMQSFFQLGKITFTLLVTSLRWSLVLMNGIFQYFINNNNFPRQLCASSM